jgi:type II secretory pathway pseudopilin PulG
LPYKRMYRNEQQNNMKKQSGFTLIETLIAIFLLTLTVGGLLTLAANGYYAVRYARNDITGNSLMQESLEYVRNSRDTAFQQGSDWATWMAPYTTNKCMTSTGCIVDPYTTSTADTIQLCQDSGCPAVEFYPTTGFYGYQNDPYPGTVTTGAAPYLTGYVRTITMQQSSDPNQLTVVVTVKWINGKAPKTVSQSILLTNWSL